MDNSEFDFYSAQQSDIEIDLVVGYLVEAPGFLSEALKAVVGQRRIEKLMEDSECPTDDQGAS